MVRRGRAEREAWAAISALDFTPYIAWRDVEARIEALENGQRIKRVTGIAMATIRRIRSMPQWAR